MSALGARPEAILFIKDESAVSVSCFTAKILRRRKS